MNKRFRVAALASAVSLSILLAACGGGGGGGAGGTPSAGNAPTPTAPAAPSTLTLSAVTAPNLTAADCNRLQTDAGAQSALNVADSQINQVNTVMQAVDPNYGWRHFIRAPQQFINWAIQASGGSNRLDALSAGVASHEALHVVSDAITRLCAPLNNYKLNWANTTYTTNLVAGNTPAYRIVDTVLPAGLKGSARYNLYILNLGNTAGNGFNMVIDELAAYTAGAETEYRWIATRGETNYANIDSGLGGMVEFMAWTQAYLQAVRTTNVAAWNAINADTQAKAALQAVWTQAENTLQASFLQTRAGASPRLDYNPQVFDYIYQAGPLNELALLGITTRTRASWVGTYL